MTRPTKYTVGIVSLLTLASVFAISLVYKTQPSAPLDKLVSNDGDVDSLSQRVVDLENQISNLNTEMVTLIDILKNTNQVDLDSKSMESSLAGLDSEPIATEINKASEARSFYDQVVSYDDAETENDVTAAGYHQSVFNKLALEVGAPELVEPLLQAINNSSLSNYSSTIEYSDANCSVNRCVFKANMSDSAFSTELMKMDEDMDEDMDVADDYRSYLNELTKSIGDKFNHDAQVVTYRKGDEISFQVIPKETRRSNRDN